MSITVTGKTITAGNVAKLTFTPTWAGATITAVNVVLLNTVDVDTPIIEITDPVTLSDEGSGVWKALIPADETSKLLRTPADANSALKYSSVYASFQITGTDADGDALTPTLTSGIIQVGRNPQAN
ncbi:MAG: hypothetical protein AAGA46_03335 [Cyanobacteria bacterium P01_F01_bin.13]